MRCPNRRSTGRIFRKSMVVVAALLVFQLVQKLKRSVATDNENEPSNLAIFKVGLLELPKCPFPSVVQQKEFIYIACGDSANVLPDSYQMNIRVLWNDFPFELLMIIPVERSDQSRTKISYNEKTGCIYLMDLRSIWKVTLDEHRVTEWLIIEQYRFDAISTTRDGDVIVLSRVPKLLEIYDHNANIIKRIHLRSRSKRFKPWNAVAATRDQLFLTFCLSVNYDCFISRLNINGEKIGQALDIQIWLPNDNPHTPIYGPDSMVLDSENDRIFLYEEVNENIRLLGFNDTHIWQLSFEIEVSDSYPVDLFYSKEKLQLIVETDSEDRYVIYLIR